MNKIKCLAIDDEPLALKQLAAYLAKVPFFEVAGCCQSALEAIPLLDKQPIDAIFIDINMPDLNGMEFVKSLQHPPLVVFTTAYQEYAVEGFKVDAIDYLLKPFGMGDIMQAADKVKRQYDLLHAASVAPVDKDETIFLKSDYRVVRIQIRDIIYIEGMSEYLRIHLSDGSKPVTVLLSMKKIEERLAGFDFMRIHKSYIVNLRHITEINRSRIVLDSGLDLPIGDSYRDALNNYISGKFLGK